MENSAAVRNHWMHLGTDEWSSMSDDPVVVEGLGDLVRDDLSTNTGESLVCLIGSTSSNWRELRAACDCSFNPIATWRLDEFQSGPRDLRRCQRNGCKSGKFRDASDGDARSYSGALFCEDCMAVWYVDHPQSMVATTNE